jgi:threonine dehydrogenase-like Zn-dependent dehydrogenase
MKAAVLTEYRKMKWQEAPVPAFTKNQVLIRVDYAGICGSDMHIFNGDFHPRTHTPMIPGHEFAGAIVDMGAEVRSFKTGDRVVVDPIMWCGKCAACLLHHYPACTSLKLLGVDVDGGFAEYVVANENMLYKLDDTISVRDGALIELFSIGFHANNRAGVKKDDTIVIWGGGRVGQCILQASRTRTDNTIFVVDILDNRLNLARDNFNNVVAINAGREDPLAVIMDRTSGRGVDVAFEAVGHSRSVANRPNPVRGCIQSIRGAGVVCVLGLSVDPTPLLMKELIWKEATIIASRVSQGEFRETIDHMAQGHLKPDVLVSAELHASEAQHGFEVIEKEPQNYLKILLKLK